MTWGSGCDQNGSSYISVDASRWDEHNETIRKAVALFYNEPYQNLILPYMTLYDHLFFPYIWQNRSDTLGHYPRLAVCTVQWAHQQHTYEGAITHNSSRHKSAFQQTSNGCMNHLPKRVYGNNYLYNYHLCVSDELWTVLPPNNSNLRYQWHLNFLK